MYNDNEWQSAMSMTGAMSSSGGVGEGYIILVGD